MLKSGRCLSTSEPPWPLQRSLPVVFSLQKWRVGTQLYQSSTKIDFLFIMAWVDKNTFSTWCSRFFWENHWRKTVEIADNQANCWTFRDVRKCFSDQPALNDLLWAPIKKNLHRWLQQRKAETWIRRVNNHKRWKLRSLVRRIFQRRAIRWRRLLYVA